MWPFLNIIKYSVRSVTTGVKISAYLLFGNKIHSFSFLATSCHYNVNIAKRCKQVQRRLSSPTSFSLLIECNIKCDSHLCLFTHFIARQLAFPYVFFFFLRKIKTRFCTRVSSLPLQLRLSPNVNWWSFNATLEYLLASAVRYFAFFARCSLVKSDHKWPANDYNEKNTPSSGGGKDSCDNFQYTRECW